MKSEYGMQDRRQFKRYSLDLLDINGKMSFTDKIADFLRPIEQNKKIESPAVVDRRLNVRFHITTPEEQVLSYPLQFRVRSISLGGMLIQTPQSVESGSMMPMELSLNDDTAITFTGRAVSCTRSEHEGQTYYDIRVEFIDLTDKDKMLLKTFIDYLAPMEGGQKG